MREVQYSEVSQLCDVPTDLGEVVTREVEPLQRVHPAVGTPNGEVGQLIVIAI